jgi:hypothetical protein
VAGNYFIPAFVLNPFFHFRFYSGTNIALFRLLFLYAVNPVRFEPKSIASGGKGILFSRSLFNIQKIFKAVTVYSGEISGLKRRMC